MVPPPQGDSLPARTGRCRECGAPLAVDQRWCVECGARRGPVSDGMRALIHGTPLDSVAEVWSAPEPRRLTFPVLNPRAAAVAVSAILGFGVIVGSVVSPAAVGQVAEPVVVAVAPPAPAPPAAVQAPAADTSATDTPVDTAVAAAPAPAPQTITVPAPAPVTPAPSAPKPLPVPPLPPLPSVSHVFVVVLSGHGYDAAFGPSSPATYLTKTLTTHGELIPNYYAIAHGGLDNEIAMVGGQGPTKQTAANCPQYGDVTPGTPSDQGQVSGDGCVYPTGVKTLADQLFTGGNTWKAYVDGLGTGKGCDQSSYADKTAVWRNPFLYFHSLIDNQNACNANVADLGQLQADLQQAGDTPALSYIVPNRCHDGSDTDCSSGDPAAPKGLAAADAWLQTVIPQIEASPGYKQGGLIAITFDAAPKDGPEADSSSCCGQPDSYPNLPADDPSQQPDPNAQQPDPGAAPTAQAANDTTTTTTPTGTPPPVKSTGGGGKVGLLLISPFVKPNTVNTTGYYNHFSLFASIEDLFTTGNIAYANLPDLTRFDKTVYTAYKGG